MEKPWRIELLGGLRVVRGDCAVTRFATQKGAALLAYLAYYRERRHPRTELVELLWPDRTPEDGRGSLSTTLYRLRRQLEPDGLSPGVLLADLSEVGLNPALVTTDVVEFDLALSTARQAKDRPHRTELLARALTLYQGPLLPDQLEDWVMQERTWRAERYFQALRDLLAGLEATGETAQAVEWAQRGVSVDPLREEAHRDLIRLFVAAGQPTAARRQYQELERLLRQHLGTSPDAATRALLKAIDERPHPGPGGPRPSREAVRVVDERATLRMGNRVASASGRLGEAVSLSAFRAGWVAPVEQVSWDSRGDAVPAVSTGGRSLRTPDAPASQPDLEPVGGAVPLDSAFYLVRPADEELQAAIARRGGGWIVLVKGARQVGKTSLLARGLDQARSTGARVLWTDFQMLNAAHLESIDALLRRLAGWLADQLDLEAPSEEEWQELRGPNENFRRYWRRIVMRAVESPIVWGMDEVDRLFAYDFASELFGMFRSWHNERAIDPRGPWQRVTLAMAYATEHHLFIADANQSPFNVGTRFALGDFTREQVADLNARYGSPLQGAADLDRFYHLVGGHPYLTRLGLHEMVTRGADLAAIEAEEAAEDGVFTDHLRRMLLLLTRDPGLPEALRAVLQGAPGPDADSFYRLRSAGVLRGPSARDAQPRCGLYGTYLARHLL